ncbi:hypothetical protein ACJX0J_039865, partial [Zea mays]
MCDSKDELLPLDSLVVLNYVVNIRLGIVFFLNKSSLTCFNYFAITAAREPKDCLYVPDPGQASIRKIVGVQLLESGFVILLGLHTQDFRTDLEVWFLILFQVGWGMITMVDAERRLLAKALEDIDNQHFVLLSDSCVPLHNFDYVYDFLMGSRHSFLDCFHDPGPHGVYRYSKNMLPEVRESEFRKGSQWFSMKRQHAMVVIADSLYYSKFRLYCRPGMEEGRNCYADEHYLPTLFHMMDPAGIANWSVTYVDWSEGKWHPRSFRAKDVTYERLKNMTSIDVSYHITSDDK